MIIEFMGMCECSCRCVVEMFILKLMCVVMVGGVDMMRWDVWIVLCVCWIVMFEVFCFMVWIGVLSCRVLGGSSFVRCFES